MYKQFKSGDRVTVSQNDAENPGAEGKYVGIMPIGDVFHAVIELANGRQIVVPIDHIEKKE